MCPRIYPGDRIRVRVGRKNYISKAVQLQANGKGYIRMRPKKSWGTPGTIKLLTEVYAEMAKRYPNGPSGYIADISRKRGGPLKPHKSHQRGVDIDLSYYKVNEQPTRGLEVMTAETLDIAKNWELIRLFINTGHIKVIFMDYKLQALLYKHLVKLGYDEKTIAGVVQYPNKKNWRARVRHSSGHHHHLHVRFDCTRPSSPCKRPRTALIADPPTQRRLAEIETTPKRVKSALVQPEVVAQPVASAVPILKAVPVASAVPVVKAELEVKAQPAAKDKLLAQILPALQALPSQEIPIPEVSRRNVDSTGTRRVGRAAIETTYEKVDWMAVFRNNLKRPQDVRKAGARARQHVPARASERPRRMSRLGFF
ncbi:MAG TPA: hypothetical protein EYN66_22470 [Myxococcales bacterium]|nr:hypothetical protein [Myxococcales bacterium]